MNWDNEQLISLIQDRSRNLDFLKTPRPHKPENNPLYEEGINVRAVKLRLKLDKIIGGDTEASLLTDIVDGIELGSSIEPISKDHSYTEFHISEFLNYYFALEIWQKENKEIADIILGTEERDLQPFSMVYTNIGKPILMFAGSNNCRSIGLNESNNIVSGRYSIYSSNFTRMSEYQIEEVLEDINFNSLRKRLINAGYDNFVSTIDKELMSIF